MEPRYYEGIKELKEAKTIQEANKLLAQNFEVLRIAEIGSLDLTTKQSNTSLVYVLGLRNGKEIKTEPKQESRIDIPSIQWTEKNSGFSWVFADSTEESKRLASIIERKGGSFTQDGFAYKVSKDGKFLNRTKEDSKKAGQNA